MNVILVDDEEVAVNALRRRVDWKKYGFEQVFIAYSLTQAQEVFRSNAIDVMVSDIEMPQGNGLELFEWVKIYYPAVECIYVTCHPEFDYVRKALQLGSADYLLKPIDYDELDGILSKLIERYKNRRRSVDKSAKSEHESPPVERKGTKKDVVEAVYQYIQEHIREDIYIADIAAGVFMNEQHLMRSFKKATGLSILEVITNERLELAKRLLVETDLPINQVADSVGYGNYSYFTRMFKRNVGMTPQTYRQEQGA